MTQEYIGVDLSKDWLDVFDLAQGHEHRVRNTARAVRGWLCKLRADVCVVIEGEAGDGVGLVRVNPGRARFFALSLGRARTDRADARVLAEMGRACGWWSWCGDARSSRTWKRRRSCILRQRACLR